ncbi:MAG: FISUMP domain-containing protein [Bacteroidota bacterium]
MKFKILFTFFLLVNVTLSQGTLGNLIDSRDGKNYKTIVIGYQIWMAENLNVSTFRNGDPIPQDKTNKDWELAGKKKRQHGVITITILKMGLNMVNYITGSP